MNRRCHAQCADRLSGFAAVFNRLGRSLMAAALLAGAAPLGASDLSVSAYTWTPDPVVHNGASTFTVTVTNNDASASVSNLALTVQLPANVDFSSSTVTNPGGTTTLSAPYTTLNCTLPSLAALGTWTVTFTGTGLTAGTSSTTASITAAGNTDPNPGNDALLKNTTVIQGADLSIAKTGPNSCTSGDVISFTLTVTNHGPDAATTFRVTDNLPALTDFTYQSANGTGWTISHSGTTLTCDYSGTAISAGADAPAITVTGKVITSNGSITNGASVATTDGNVGDPVAANNGPSQKVVTVAAGTTLRVNKTMVSTTTGMTVYAQGETVTLSLSATNQGPQNATGVVITDIVPSDFTLAASSGTGWTATGQTVTCTVGNLASGATSATCTIPLLASGSAGASGTNTATIVRTTPTGGTNTSASVSYQIVLPFAHLTLTKTKGPNPVAADGTITNTIVVTNAASSTSAAVGNIQVTDLLSPHETYVSIVNNGWTASGLNVGDTGTLTCTYSGANLARGASLPSLVITTKAETGYLGSIANTATAVGNSYAPADTGVPGSATATVTGSNLHADIMVTKAASSNHLLVTDSGCSYTITISNLGPDPAPTVNVSDALPMWYSGSAGTTGGSATLDITGAGESATFGSTCNFVLKNLASGDTRTLTINLVRPLKDNTSIPGWTNSATASSPDSIDDDPSNNTGSCDMLIDPLADVAVTNIASAPSPGKVGVELTYTTSLKNNGPSTATGVVLDHTIDTARVTYVTSSASLTGSPAGTITYFTSLPDGPYAGQAGLRCTGFSMPNGQSRQLIFKVIPVYPYPDFPAPPAPQTANYTSYANIRTATPESDAPTYGNNTLANTVQVTVQALDLAVTDNDPGYDPTVFGDPINYAIVAKNNGPSLATGFELKVTPTAPGGGYTMNFDAAGSSLPAGTTYTISGSDILFHLGADRTQSLLAPNSSQTFHLQFFTDNPVTGLAPSGSLTYQTSVSVESYETEAGADSLTGNNSVAETTTVLPKTDLILVSKTVSKPVVDLNEEFTYIITIGNKGPSQVSALSFSDVLPSGFVRTATPITVVGGSGVSLATNTISGPASGAGGTVGGNIGPLPADATGADTTKQVAITIPVRAAYQTSGTYAFGFNTNIANTASVAVLPGISLDPVASNNSQTVNVQVRRNSLAGTVFRDVYPGYSNPPVSTGNGVNGVTVTLTGTDAYGYTYQGGGTYAALTRTTNASGAFSFATLPPGTWTLVESQPANYKDGLEAAGTAGGTAPPLVLDGTQNGGSAASFNTISGISLPADIATAATGYLFQELQGSTVSGYAYHDANNNGIKDAGETTGIAGLTIQLSGTDYTGHTYSTTTTTAADGSYSFANVPPGDGYAVTESSQPSGWLDGLEQNGTGTVVPGSKTTDTISVGTLQAGTTYGNRNFGELQPVSLGGYVFIDPNSNAVRDAGETAGVTGVTISLTGTDDLGNAISLSTTTIANGAYSFLSSLNLRPGTYALAETIPADLTHTGAQAGSKGGTIGGTSYAAGSGVPGAGYAAITAIPMASGNSATGNNFGEHGQGLSGYVYLDLNGNGVMDAGEPGLAGVQVALSGFAADGRSVCVAISPSPCSVTTDASGAYNFRDLPASDPAGYTLTEMSQTLAPLSSYADGPETAGSLGGSTAVNEQISSIVLPNGGYGTGYNFAEIAGSISGRVYLDGGASGIANVAIALSGTATGTTTTAADGTFHFTGLPAGTFTLTEAQPVDYANDVTIAPSANGTAASGTSITGITVNPGSAVTGAIFGEKTGSLGGLVYEDGNNNGLKDAGEAGISGVTLHLTGTSASGAAISQSTTTLVSGSYTFTNLPNAGGSGYTVAESQPSPYLDGKVSAPSGNTTVANTISAVAFSAASTYSGYNFGELVAASLGGRIYQDLNANGTYDSGEELAGVTLTLAGVNDLAATVNMTTTTATDGTYLFSNLRPSDATGYSITESQPTGLGDYTGASGTLIGTVGGTPVGTAAKNQVAGIVLASGQPGIHYDFRDNASSLAGFVYLDANDNGLKDSGETGIAGVTVTLTGTDASSISIYRSTTSAPDGSYRFTGLLAGLYNITETQPCIYQDGREAAGSPSGTVDNGSFTSAAPQNQIGAIMLPAATAGNGYLFGERGGLVGAFSGKAWLNSETRDQIQQGGEPGLAGWIVELRQGGSLRGSTTTASDGTWMLGGLPAATGYEIVFRNPSSHAVYGTPVSHDPGYADSTPDYSGHTIANMTLRSGGNVVLQDLPVDPSGVVYDAITRHLVPGATVAFNGPAGFDPATHLVGGTGNQTQVTDATGFYQFLLMPSAPVGTYTITINGPAGYVPGASSIIPPSVGVLGRSAGPGTYAVQPQATAPSGTQATTYYLALALGGTAASIVNNHLPVDPVLGGAIFLTKTTPKRNAARGELVPYTITARNTLAATLSNIDLVDELPPGFKYRAGSARLNGIAAEPIQSGRHLYWRALTFAAQETKTLALVLVVGSGVGDGEYTNTAWALNNLVNTLVSNVGSATVKLTADPDFDCTDVIGKVFDDRNANGYQDEGEPGLPNIGLATVNGRIVTTDPEGRFHIPCADVPQMDRGSNFILKLDERTLPSGYRMTTENPRVVRTTRGKMVKINFGATIHRVVKLEVKDEAFETGNTRLKKEWQDRLAALPGLLEGQPSVLRLVYLRQAEAPGAVQKRLDALVSEIRKRWKEAGGRYPLSIEQEVTR